MSEFAKTFLPFLVLLTYIVAMVFNFFFGSVGSMTDFILGLILIMIYATRGE